MQSKPAQRPWKESKHLLASFPPRAGHCSSAPCSCGHPMAEENSWIGCRSEVKSSGLPYGQMPKDKGSHTMILQGKECQGGAARVVLGLGTEHFPTIPSALPVQELFSRSITGPTSTIPEFKFLWLLIQLLFPASLPLQTHEGSERGHSSTKGCPRWWGRGPLLNIPPPHLHSGNAPL